MIWQRLATAVTGRRSWLLALGVFLVSVGFMVVIGGNAAAGQAPPVVPTDSDSAKVQTLSKQFPGGDRVPLIVVVNRVDGAADRAALQQAGEDARNRMLAAAGAGQPGGAAAPVLVSEDGRAAIAVVPISADLSGMSLNDAVAAQRDAAATGLPAGMAAHVTGGPAFGADIANAFAGANITLLAVTASVVALLLIATYRSPVLWLVPLLVIAFADRMAAAVGTAVASLTGLSFDGSTSGITSVLVFGAGTNYALLLISRYRQELRRHSDHRDALARAVRAAGPAVVASNATVVLALLTLIAAWTPSTRSLGALAACGLLVAVLSVLLLLPPLLALCGRRLFWPFVPQPEQQDDPAPSESGVWHRVAESVARRPALVASLTVVVLAALATGLLSVRIGLTQTEQFRVRADSVTGYDVVAAHFPAGSANPTEVIAPTDRSAQVQQAITATPGVVSARPAGTSPAGLTKWSVVTDAAPSSPQAFKTIAALRNSTASFNAVVGGPDAQALDARDAAVHDRDLLIPAILAVILLVLYVLLRSALAPPTLLAATILGALAALGLGGWASMHVVGFPALDNIAPLYAFLFLAALGVDYTIFLVTRAREEAAEHGARDGMVRAVSVTGGVITSAGIVLAAVFCVLGVLPLIVMTQLGIIVGLGILLDTFVVRTLVIPALFALIGDRIWWPAALNRKESI
ncbi:membrane protein [Mycobacterium kiyosense]|uniref:Membrane protein n=1 Tax=Mycobacterium kiyosense TaxID=2871094 RepID=A0A9P3Q7N2_9MYCO|nr:MMPL family transporter [Mycobacterium kiyosense]GLB82057.1 membrane protein [Mycobacterium kiyosense]GLB95199.1 membrane protein [Mycobacterium kiyosense]GLC07596.1 membrane protein [Mycobacterium kiyosense]GLD30308.1 membrane protein [Mycobacterium kiyosense]GLD35536.1 membrane protein [Mycobacterium kiyosense]